MISIGMSALIDTHRTRVWRSLTTPAELIRWDHRLLALIDPLDDYPCAGQEARWRFRLGSVPITLRERIVEVEADARLRAEVSLGLFRFTSTYVLSLEEGSPDRTRVALSLVAGNAVPLVGGELDRFDVRRSGTEFVDTRLRLLKQWCERRPRQEPGYEAPRAPTGPGR